MAQNHVIVGGHRYGISGAQIEAFMRQRQAVVLEKRADMAAAALAERDAFLTALPKWALYDMVEAADALASRARELLEGR